MGLMCCIINCSSKANGNSSGISFHRLPFRRSDLLKRWMECIGRNIMKLNRNSRICSRHFTESCFYYEKGKKFLRIDALPSLFEKRITSSQKRATRCFENTGTTLDYKWKNFTFEFNSFFRELR